MLDKYNVITIKGFVKRHELIREDGMTYDLLNYYAFKNELEHGYFQVKPLNGYYWLIRKIITSVEITEGNNE